MQVLKDYTILYGFIEKLQKSSQDQGAAKLIGENDNVVRIMSIHKSKGLEFPVVFLCSMGKGFNMMDLNGDMLLHQEIGFGPKYIDTKNGISYNTLAKEAVKVKLKNEIIAEEMRVLYVALTRAKEKLIMVGTKKDIEKDIKEKQTQIAIYKDNKKLPVPLVKCKSSYLDWVLYTTIFKKEEMEKQIETIIHKQDEFLIEEKQEKSEWKPIDENAEISKEILESLTWNYPNINVTKIPSKISISQIEQMEYENKIVANVKLKMPKFLEKESKITGSQKGTIMHKVLQMLDLKKEYTNEDIIEFVERLVANKVITEKEKEAVSTAQLYNFAQSGLAKEIRMAKEIYKEKPFYLSLPASRFYACNTNDTILLQGIIDLYFRNSEGKLILVDYKTDHVTDKDELIQKYHKQIEIYKEAIERATGEKVHMCYIYSLAKLGTVSITNV